MKLTWKDTRKISWNLTQPLSAAKMYGKDDLVQIPKTMWDATLPVKKGDVIIVLTESLCQKSDRTVYLTEPVRGNNLRDVLKSVERGINRKISYKNKKYKIPTSVIYRKIGYFFYPKDRLELVNKYEGTGVKPVELYGDHIHFEGLRRRGKSIYLDIWTGS